MKNFKEMKISIDCYVVVPNSKYTVDIVNEIEKHKILFLKMLPKGYTHSNPRITVSEEKTQ